ncbi:glycine--tRNA ligase subunit beta [Solemya velum gill symbiont]|uniref:Glycine--tRNA ligase beta subunit n=1 Tax=Solemya velum gill symbiont TaxID=2340 RepID=A0A0B0HD55_SOVGS|nr:glycine--tRNA ligase subunit beta [Solemya velum gill symbiont]KHF26537.1 glycyl-tRNA synthetase, beta chain [Solemya velum gill symbiont]OOY52657.1 glycine--tRNA ligase subunit beta [Solemya velum gill symbiont]OOY65821.1 glycine--tRNA ligase subunit beta [Solemya velum gill symbiont]OOY67782.1 glycine--tRNA ligase subunit beta [Solemya velum gill symbiont]OOY70315.1 glycine--tRNA ligase subunit beta [Solemya velum gill symbiont]
MSTNDLLFELGTEELPPTALKRLRNALEQHFVDGLDKTGLQHGTCKSFASPRRLALLIEDVATRQADREIEKRGPAVAAAFDADGNPTKAAEGFARSCGTSVDQLERMSTDKGEWLYYKVEEKGKDAAELLPQIAMDALNQLPIPKRMRWGASDAEFVRPVHWLLFLHGNDVVPCTLLDTEAGKQSFGHRFHYPQAIDINKPGDYAAALSDKGFVIADFDQRREAIRKQVETTAKELGGEVEFDEDLLDEVTALVEWPVPVAGGFEQSFLEVPHEALILTMKKNQKYFHLVDSDGNLLPHFITISNIDSSNPGVISEGNERVIRPRLADAMFFWQQDGKKRLEDHIESLRKVVFQNKLGNMHEKSERVALLAATIAASIGGDQDMAVRAARLSRCDLMTEMVNEFADMQGVMGRYQALRDGENGEIASAMEEFYLPRFSGDILPQTKTGIAIALAERLDTLVGIFGIGQKPTGDKDPFALRRASIAILRMLRELQLPLSLDTLLEEAKTALGERVTEKAVVAEVKAYMLERLRGIYAEAGTDADTFQAVAKVNPQTLDDFDARISAVSAFRELAEAESLSAANKRIHNLLKKVEGDLPAEIDTALFEKDAESLLLEQLTQTQQQVAPLIASREYTQALQSMAQLRDVTDSYFDDVMVMAEDMAIRNNRLAMLNRLNGLFLEVADISALQG